MRKLWKSSVKVFKQIWTSTQHRNEEMEGLRKWNQLARWRQWFGRPVPTAVSVVHLVGAARYLNLRTHSPGHPVLNTQLRTLSPHCIPLELRSHRPRPITLVSLQGRLPNLHRLCSPDNPQWLLDAQNETPNHLEDTQSSSLISLQVTQTERLQWCLTLFGSGCLGFVLARISLSKASRWVALKTTKAVN